MKLRDFFYVQRSDREVIIVLLLVMAVALGILFATGGDEQTPASAQADSTLTATPEGDTTRVPIYYKVEEQATELFAFDPNKADSTQLLRLGLQPWQVRNIYKYRAAGGVYRKKEDFARLYGLTVEKYRQLEPYIRISSDYAPASTLFADDAPASRPDTLRYPQKLSEGETLDLNAADTTLLRRVPGIGSYYARRIADYGNRLGGYVNTGQLQEIEGFPVEALPYFTISATDIRKLNINRLPLSDLRRHPYLNYYQAKAIVDYRRRHGRIADLDDLRLLPDFPAETIGRLRPYVEY
jgi:DNA uptake protein ComE-like DNA-binding protein